MFKFWRKKKPTQESEAIEVPAAPVEENHQEAVAPAEEPTQPTPEQAAEPASLTARFTQGLTRTRRSFSQGLANTFLGKKTLDPELFEQLEAQLLKADIGVHVTERILAELTASLGRQELTSGEDVLQKLKQQLSDTLAPSASNWSPQSLPSNGVILMVGVNGAGKTTTLGKLCKRLQGQGKSVLLAAGDTFRAAAIDQLKRWGERNNTPVIAQEPGADSAAVLFDAFQAAKARNVDILLADTAGRLHTQSHLMQELQKVTRVLQKLDPNAPHETWLVLDASTGQNGLAQAQQFHQALGLTGIVLTKLDGTAKGGIVFAIADQLGLPIRFIGIGEDIDDLQPFDAQAFVDALFA